MKTNSFCLLLSVFLCASAIAEEANLQAFAEQYAIAKHTGDAEALLAMHYLEGATDAEIAKVKEKIELGIKYKNIDKHTAVELEGTLDPDLMFTQIRKGEKIETNLVPVGMIRITYPKGAHLTPYGLKDGKPWLLGYKITKLDWNGPEEDFYQVTVMNKGDAPVAFTIDYAYKASGLALQEKRERIVKVHGSNGTSIIANEVVSLRISTAQEDARLEVAFSRSESGMQKEILKKECDSSSPFVYQGKQAQE